MNVALVVPDFLSGTSFLQQPLDFLYCATLLERSGHRADIFDCRTRATSIPSVLNDLRNYQLIIVTTTPCDQVQNYFVDYRYGYAINMINRIKTALPRITLAVSGAHGSVRPDLVEKDCIADIIIKGEVMVTAVMLANCLAQHLDLEMVANICIRTNQDWKSTKYQGDTWHPHLDDSILPSFHKVPMSCYFGVEYCNNIPVRRQNRAVLQSGRGCPYHCSFCHNFYGRNVRRRPPEVVADEAEICFRDFNVKEIFFLDELFTGDRSWVIQFFGEIIRRSIKLSFTIQTRIDCLDDDLLEIMYNGGVRDIWLGIESGDEGILQLSHKRESNAQLLPVICMIRNHHIRPNAFFMLGMPGETIETLNKTLRVIYDGKIPYTRSIMICTPRYNTPYYEMAKQQYPFVENHWYYLNAVKGLVANEMTPFILQQAKDILKDRDFLYKQRCPQL